MAVDMFLKIDGIDGESQDKSHKGEIDVLSFSWGVHNATSRGGSGGGSGKATAEDFTFTHLVDKASPALMLACAAGKHISQAQLTVRKAGGDKAEYLKVKLQDVFVSSMAPDFQKADEEDLPLESFTLNFAKLHITEIANDGSVNEADLDFSSSG